jgi:hypothetical protein
MDGVRAISGLRDGSQTETITMAAKLTTLAKVS